MRDRGEERHGPGAGPPRIRVAPSILSADFAHLAEQVRAAEEGGADLIHVDVMDGHFVPNLTLGPAVVRSLRRVTRLPLDTHLMVTDPLDLITPFAEAGADILTFHCEAVADPAVVARAVRRAGATPGVALNPDTPLEEALPALGEVDLLLVMTVHPGFGGQAFRADVLPKLRRAAAHKREAGLGFAIEVDGGISPDTAAAVVEAGAEILVAGSAVFGRGEPGANVRALRRAAGTTLAADR